MPFTRDELVKYTWDRWVSLCAEAGIDPEEAARECLAAGGQAKLAEKDMRIIGRLAIHLYENNGPAK